MDKVIVDFIQALRHHGLPVSPAESLDAMHAVAAIGLADKQRLRVVLGLTLAKTLSHQGQLNDLFDRFFSSTDNENHNNGWPPKAELSVSDSHTGIIQSTLGQWLHQNDHSRLHQKMLIAAEQAGARDMSIFLQKKMIANRIILDMGDRALQREIQQWESRGLYLQMASELKAKRQRWIDDVHNFVEQQFLLHSSQHSASLSERNLQKIKLSHVDGVQLQKMERLVHKVAKKLASLHSRKRKVSKRGHLDMRKTISANAAFEGLLMHTRWKSTRKDRPKLMVICDISGSVSIYARFLLLFVYALQEALPNVRSFVFSNRLTEISQQLQQQDAANALNSILDKWSGGSTDYGRALEDFSDIALHKVDHNTQIIMLGDARNNYDTGRSDIWKTAYTRAQRVLWLNPEDRSRWNTGDSIMKEYAPFCSVVEACKNLQDMERIFSRLLKSR